MYSDRDYTQDLIVFFFIIGMIVLAMIGISKGWGL